MGDSYRGSYWKTVGLASGASLLALLLAVWLPLPLGLPAALLFLFTACIAVGGLICLRRDANQARGISWAPRSRAGSAAGAGGRRALTVGDRVEVRPAAEILASLDAEGALDAMPCMPEMLAFCGKRFQVSQRADKILDMIDKSGHRLRRMRRAVFLDDLRCDGSAHGGCQQGCKLIWKTAWLRRVEPGEPDPVEPRAHAAETPREIQAALLRHARRSPEIYRCQATELLRASTPMHALDPRQDLRALATGNVRALDFVRILLVRAFRFAQQRRGGAHFPYYVPSCVGTTPTARLDLQPGEWVEVKSLREIEATLDPLGRNRGMRFDPEMVRYCGSRHRVQSRVERILDERTGRLMILKNPCIILEGVEATGEFLRFNPQREYPYWREIWLRRCA